MKILCILEYTIIYQKEVKIVHLIVLLVIHGMDMLVSMMDGIVVDVLIKRL